MKKNDFMQIKGLDIKELAIKAKNLKTEIGGLVMDKNMKKLKDLKMIFKKRKDLAQILTILRQNELLKALENKISEKSSNEKEVRDGQSRNVTKLQEGGRTGLSK